jgi:signal peptidase II
VTARRHARIYDALALLTATLVITFDQWTKALVVANYSPPGSKAEIPLLGKYLVIAYIQNSGAAFGLFAEHNGGLLAIFIIGAIGVVAYLYARVINAGSLASKIVFGMIIGGAVGNLIDRARHSGYVVDFISFRIPEINYYFAIFNIADACISVGVFLLFIFMLFGNPYQSEKTEKEKPVPQPTVTSSTKNSGALCATEQDAQS